MTISPNNLFSISSDSLGYFSPTADFRRTSNNPSKALRPPEGTSRPIPIATNSKSCFELPVAPFFFPLPAASRPMGGLRSAFRPIKSSTVYPPLCSPSSDLRSSTGTRPSSTTLSHIGLSPSAKASSASPANSYPPPRSPSPPSSFLPTTPPSSEPLHFPRLPNASSASVPTTTGERL